MKNRYMLLVIALVCSACAVQVDKGSPTPTQDPGTASSAQVNTSGPDHGGNNCSKPLYVKINGQWFYEPGSCPLKPPQLNYPDPAQQVVHPEQPTSPVRSPHEIQDHFSSSNQR